MKRLLTVIAGLVVLGVLGFVALAWRPAITPISRPPPGSFASDLVAQGEALSGGGFCAVCHTAKGGQTYAGGYPMQTPFGVIYSTNITPDSETGIGTWSRRRSPGRCTKGWRAMVRISSPRSLTTISPSSPTMT